MEGVECELQLYILSGKIFSLLSMFAICDSSLPIQADVQQQYNDNVSLHAIMSYRIAEAVPLPGSITFAELSKKTGVPEALVTRLIRHAITYNCFREPSPGQVEHTASSVALHNGGTVRDWLDMTFEEWGPASVKAVEALRRFPDSEEQNEGAFALAFDRQTMFEYLAKRPERAKVFGSAMGNFSKGASHKVEYLVESYDWQGLGDSTVVDVSVPCVHLTCFLHRLT
jgi:hypothetical protein